MEEQSKVTIGAPGTEYGNWMSSAAIKSVGGILGGLAVAFVLIAFLTDAKIPLVIIGILCILFLLLFIDVLRIRKALAYDGGKAMDLMQQNLMRHLEWDGQGKALDVGCGSGTLSIRAAKTYPDATVTGIDYWGMGWDYSKSLCEKNAELEGVNERCAFLKGDAKHLEFEDGTFDALISNCVYSQMMQKTEMGVLIAESLRTLKEGGSFAIQDYFDRKMFGDINETISYLKEHGISEVHYQGGFDKADWMPRVVVRPYCINGVGVLWGKK